MILRWKHVAEIGLFHLPRTLGATFKFKLYFSFMFVTTKQKKTKDKQILKVK